MDDQILKAPNPAGDHRYTTHHSLYRNHPKLLPQGRNADNSAAAVQFRKSGTLYPTPELDPAGL
jgi:hypothetical protein